MIHASKATPGGSPANPAFHVLDIAAAVRATATACQTAGHLAGDPKAVCHACLVAAICSTLLWTRQAAGAALQACAERKVNVHIPVIRPPSASAREWTSLMVHRAFAAAADLIATGPWVAVVGASFANGSNGADSRSPSAADDSTEKSARDG